MISAFWSCVPKRPGQHSLELSPKKGQFDPLTMAWSMNVDNTFVFDLDVRMSNIKNYFHVHVISQSSHLYNAKGQLRKRAKKDVADARNPTDPKN
ncbi:hypothetical protein N7509_001957 [Penicillium cosmopolitanum]|uniref:Uncharacterized protein n=1 Tax=Penicillium cosmopolitanum TaxID=1131564 RepID=A0A9X0BD11_9EURO|nr:uncharacterized protein N7509_001957 [Penicillium cosmopolitanum]KAJ5408074.1 hypothetical protein N7509_001957 [Penicillium cosmopolitanum]